jgi:hypothetical protein
VCQENIFVGLFLSPYWGRGEGSQNQIAFFHWSSIIEYVTVKMQFDFDSPPPSPNMERETTQQKCSPDTHTHPYNGNKSKQTKTTTKWTNIELQWRRTKIMFPVTFGS